MKRTSQDRFYQLVLVAIFALANSTIATASPAPRVTICHFPPDDPADVQLLTVGAPAVPAHLSQHHDAVCAAGNGDCCFGAPSLCTNFQTDPNNCGGCGNVCGSGTTCTGGSCVSPCAPGTTPCNGACVDESTDPNNCGGCGNVCGAGTTCTGGSCVSVCAPGETFCNGACVDASTDPNNCGSCGNVCGSGTTCTGGSCVSVCAPGESFCDGVCVDASTDPNNCGGCGTVCAPGTACTGGSCENACPAGTTLCGTVCVNEGTDDNNCGSCGVTCPAGSTCTGGSCQSGCPAGETQCGVEPVVCVNENTDPNNCGSCGMACAAGTTCTAGTCTAIGVAASCLPTSSLSVLIQGTAVTAYVPRGSWTETTPGVVVVPLEPSVGSATLVDTAGPVNSCSSNGVTGLTVCTGNSNDVYVLNGTALVTTLTAGATGSQNFSGGTCMTCGVATDAGTGLAWLAEGTINATGQLQSLDPAASAFGVPLDLFGQDTSEDISVDPVRRLILSANEAGNFQIVNSITNAVFNAAAGPFLDPTFPPPSPPTPLELNATAEDCSTGIAAAPAEFTSFIVLTDLSQAAYTPGSPGTWSAPTTIQNFPDFASFTAAGISGMAIAPGSHLAGVTDEFGGPAFGVVRLPATGGAGAPVAPDYVAASMPNDPSGAPWSMGLDPHTVTAYTSPNSGKAILAISNVARTYLALVDMQALLAAPRLPGTNTVDQTVTTGIDLVGSGLVTFVAE